MSLQAYQQAASRAESPRDSEYRLFAQVTLALMEAAKTDPSDIPGRIDALDWNRSIWSVLHNDCSSPDNQLPAPLLADAIGATGLPGSAQRLTCVGPAAPIPDWQTYATNPSSPGAVKCAVSRFMAR